MDAISYLTDQHHEIDSLFDQFASAARVKTKLRLCRKLLDLLAVHAAIEETIFYPAAQSAVAEPLLPGALARHLSAEQIVAEILDAGADSHEAAAWMAVLKECKAQHARDEEQTLFPRVRELLSPCQLAKVGARMASVADQLLAPGVGARERIAARRAVA